jgi:hypothetical protein
LKAPKPLLSPLSAELEAYVLGALVRGQLAATAVYPEELTKVGRAVYQAVQSLTNTNATLDPKQVYLLASESGVAPKEQIRDCIKTALVSDVVDVSRVLDVLHGHRALLGLAGEITEQLRTGHVHPERLLEQISSITPSGDHELVPVGELLKDGLPPVPEGASLKTLPKIQSSCGGIYGVWALGGMPKVGKSTLAWQMALDAGRTIPVIYYDFENGLPTLLARTAIVFNHDLDRIRAVTRQVYHRGSLRSLSTDLAGVGPPALVVVDSIQKIPTSGDDRRVGLDRWVHRLEELKKRGYHVLMVSEINRASYDSEPSMGGYKETGEIEYTADCGLHLTLGGDFGYVYAVAHRHRPTRGLVSTIRRIREWWWEEC